MRIRYGPNNHQAMKTRQARRVDGKSLRLADEVRYIQRSAADHDGRVVTVGQLVLFSTETGDAWLLDPPIRFRRKASRSP